MGGYGSGRRVATPDTDDCIRISLSDLRRSGAVRRGLMARRDKDSYFGSTRVGSLTIVVDIDCLEPKPCLRITGMAFGHYIDQRLPIIVQPQPFGGERFYVLCPLTERRCTSLILPPGRTSFASVRGWGVPYTSTRERELVRALRNIDRLEKRLRSMSKYTRGPTRQRLAENWDHANSVINAEEGRLKAIR